MCTRFTHVSIIRVTFVLVAVVTGGACDRQNSSDSINPAAPTTAAASATATPPTTPTPPATPPATPTPRPSRASTT